MGALWLLDIDEVLLEFMPEFIHFYNMRNLKRHGIIFVKEDINTYDLWKVFGITEQEAVNEVQEFNKTINFRNLSACRGAIDFVNKIKGNCVAVTARTDSTYEATKYNLDLRFGAGRIRVRFAKPYSLLTGGNHPLGKREICLQEGARYAVEDSALHAINLAGVCEEVYLVNQPWNVGINEVNTYKNIIRIKSLDEIRV